MPQQQALAKSAPMERVKRMNVVMVHPNQRVGFAQCNPYAIDIDKGNRNYYSCGGFGHLARNCRIEEQETELRRVEDWNIGMKDKVI